MKLTAVILAGGKSSRFGQDKTKLCLDGKTLVEHQVELCRQFCSELIVVSNQPGKFPLVGVNEICDNFAGCGPLGGIEAGLSRAKNDVCLVLAVDMPLINQDLIKCMLANWRAADFDLLLPEFAGQLQPLCGLYKSSLAVAAARCLTSGRQAVKSLLDEHKCQILPEALWRQAVGESEVFLNINHQEDYQRLLAELKKQESRYGN